MADTVSILEGVDENTTRVELLRRLREAAEKLHVREDSRVGKLQEIEERVRKSYAGTQEPLLQIIATASEKEWAAAVDFLENFAELLPVALLRLHDGAKGALGRNASTRQVAPYDR